MAVRKATTMKKAKASKKKAAKKPAKKAAKKAAKYFYAIVLRKHICMRSLYTF